MISLIVLTSAAIGGANARVLAQDGGTPLPRDAETPAIVALGDSLTSGHRLSRSQAYPALLQDELRRAGLAFRVINHGVNGDTTARALRRVEAALAEQPRILIVALGANDGLRGVPIPDVRANLERIITTAQDRGVSVLLVGMEALPIYGWQYTIDFHNLFRDLAARHRVPLVPFMLNGVIGNPDLMSADGIHPNAAGTQAIAATIWPYLRTLASETVTATR
jgi:acyl-CoA thioesterase-1